MDFSFHKEITKDFILSKVSQEQIFCFYLHLPYIGKKLVRNITRVDNNPTCGFYKTNGGNVIMHDFATGEKLNCFSLVAKLNGCNYFDALKIIANDFNLLPNKNSVKTQKLILEVPELEEKTSADIRCEIQDFTKLELEWWNSFGITESILKKFDVHSCKNLFLNGNLILTSTPKNMMFGYYGGKTDNLEMWRVYRPNQDVFRFITNWPSSKVQGYSQLPESGKLLVITKSMKDVMCLYSFGITAIAPNSETQFVTDEMLDELKSRFKYIVVMFDNDLSGISNMNKQKKKYPELIYTWIPRDCSKDISDFYKKYGRSKTAEFLKERILWLNKHSKHLFRK